MYVYVCRCILNFDISTFDILEFGEKRRTDEDAVRSLRHPASDSENLFSIHNSSPYLRSATKPRRCQGCQIFLGTAYKNGKIYQITINHIKWPQNIPNGRRIDQMA
jgi:hypothetical protein